MESVTEREREIERERERERERLSTRQSHKQGQKFGGLVGNLKQTYEMRVLPLRSAFLKLRYARSLTTCTQSLQGLECPSST